MSHYQTKGVFIAAVKPNSISARLGIRPGYQLQTINRVRPRDYIHYRFLTADERILLRVTTPWGENKLLAIDKLYDEDLGMSFNNDCFDGIHKCRNNCLFCFINQLPVGLRSSLYIKDDDYRLSFLHGNFLTLTNLQPEEITRIINFHLSPLYVSVHATDPKVRGLILGKKNPQPVLQQLQVLIEGGVKLHTQVVLCPGINDGHVLEQTIADLFSLRRGILSVGLVPVGLTKFRDGLPFLRAFTKLECRNLIKKITFYQEFFRKNFGSSFIYLSDEFYLRAGISFPHNNYYDNFPQLENGIGMCRLFYDEFQELKRILPRKLPNKKRFLIATGYLGAQFLKPIIARLNLITNLNIKLLPITNNFFGPRVQVAGLLTGSDLILGLRKKRGEEVLLPKVILRQNTSYLLDNMKLNDVAKTAGCKLTTIQPDACSLVETLLSVKTKLPERRKK